MIKRFIDPALREVIGADYADDYLERKERYETRNRAELEFDDFVVLEMLKGKRAKVAIRKVAKKLGTNRLKTFRSDEDQIEYYLDLKTFEALQLTIDMVLNVQKRIKENEEKLERLMNGETSSP